MTLLKPDGGGGVSPNSPAAKPNESARWWIALLAVLPIACCGLPLLLAAGVVAGTGALVGGAAGVGLVVAAAVLIVTTLRRRRAAGCQVDSEGTHRVRQGDCS